MLDMCVYNPLVMKHFHGISVGNVQACSLKFRIGKARIIKWKNKDAATVVLTFMKGNAVYASIASTESLDVNLFARYFQQPLVGILCRMEGAAKNGVTSLDPIWIWHEAP
jgi:hypothetical protein